MAAPSSPDSKSLTVPEAFTPIRRSFETFKLEDALASEQENFGFVAARAHRSQYARVPRSPSPEPGASQLTSTSSYGCPSPLLDSPMLRRRKGHNRATSPTPPGTAAPTPALGGSRWSWARLSLRTVQAFRAAGLNRRTRVSDNGSGDNDDDDEDEAKEGVAARNAQAPFLARGLRASRGSMRSTSPNIFQRAAQQIRNQVRVINAFRNTMFRHMMVSAHASDPTDPLSPLPESARMWQASIHRIMFQLRVVRAFRDCMVRRVMQSSPNHTAAAAAAAHPRRDLWLHTIRLIVFQLRVAHAFRNVLLRERLERESPLLPLAPEAASLSDHEHAD
jgi:hypothetical protein